MPCQFWGFVYFACGTVPNKHKPTQYTCSMELNRRVLSKEERLNLQASKFDYNAVLVDQGCNNRIPQTGWFIGNRNLFLTALEAEVQDQGTDQQIQCLVRVLLPDHRQQSSVSSCGGRDKEISGASFRGTNAIHEGSILMTYSAPKTTPPSTITQETRFQHVNFGGDTNIQSIADGNLKTSCRRNQKVGMKTGLGVGKRQSEVDWLSQVPTCRPQYSGAIYNRRDVCCSGLKQKTLITQRCWHLSQYLHQEKSSTFTNYFHIEFQIQLLGEKNCLSRSHFLAFMVQL